MYVLLPLAAAGAGALLMYLFDPQQGRRRVALARDQLRHLAHRGRAGADVGLRDLRHRASGVVAGLQRGRQAEPVDDPVLVERVRAHLGRLSWHPHAIEVQVNGGRVTLSGHVLQREHGLVLQGVESVRGVQAVEDRLLRHETPHGVPWLQGGNSRSRTPAVRAPRNWPPGPRLLALTAGALVTAGVLARLFAAKRHTV